MGGGVTAASSVGMEDSRESTHPPGVHSMPSRLSAHSAGNTQVEKHAVCVCVCGRTQGRTLISY